MRKIILNLIIGATLGLIYSPSFAQRELRITPAYVLPLGELGTVYQPSIGIALSTSKFDSFRKKRSGSSWELGYVKFSPSQEVFYFGDDEPTIMRYKDYHVFQLSLYANNQHYLTKNFTFDWGIGLGVYYVKYEYDMDSPYKSESAYNIEPKGVLRPQLGFSYDLSEHIGIGCYSQYSLMLGKPTGQGYFQHFLSNSLNSYYRF